MNGISIFAQVFGPGESYSCTTNTFDVLAPPDGLLGNPSFLLPAIVEPNIPVTGLIATFSDSDPSPNLSDFAAMIYWGNGTQSPGVVGLGSQAGTLSVSAPPGGHTYSTGQGQTYSVRIDVTLYEVIAPNQNLTATGVIIVSVPTTTHHHHRHQ
jgi:hypothetical protein